MPRRPALSKPKSEKFWVPDWDEDSPRLRENLAHIRDEIIQSAKNRATPSLETAREWQRQFMEGLEADEAKYVGSFRGEPGLENVTVKIGGRYGVLPGAVAEQLNKFEAKLQKSVDVLDAMRPQAKR
jgi:hypothetical protein